MPRVGLLRPGSPPDFYVDAFRRGLHDLGYVERQTIALEYRWAEGRLARFPRLAAELVQLKVDVIVTQGEEAARAVKEANVFLARVGGLLDELRARPFRNVQTHRHLRGQDSEGCEARRPSHRTAHEVRAGDQPQDRQGPWPHQVIE